MIDIIIPCYNSAKTLSKTLASITCQKNSDLLKIYLIDDGSTDKYDEIIEVFNSDLTINYLRLDKNSGPGVARNLGLKNSTSEYIIFIDSDDTFYSPFSCKILYDSIRNAKSDIAVSIEKEEKDNFWMEKKFFTGDLHGKIYRRKFLEDNGILFNNSYTSEDNSFNQICFLLDPKVEYVDEITYIYRDNSSSLTNKRFAKEKLQIDYMNNIIYTVNVLKGRDIDSKRMAKLVLSGYLYLYYSKCPKLKELQALETVFEKYEHLLTDREIKDVFDFALNNALISLINSDDSLPDYSFQEFRQMIINS